MLRLRMIGDKGVNGIAVNRASEAAVFAIRAIVSDGDRRAANVAGPNPRTVSWAVLAAQPKLSRTTACARPSRSRSSPVGSAGIGPRS